MPYWCENDLTITGPDVQRVLDAIRTAGCAEEDARVIDFNRLIPYPQHFRDLDQRSNEYRQKFIAVGTKDPKRENKLKTLADEYGVQPGTPYLKNGYDSGGYEWVCKNWATQSNAVEDRLTMRQHTIPQTLIEFVTAWTPPLPVIHKLAVMFPDHQFELSYYESGVGFCGHACWSGGVKTHHELREYDGPRGG